VFDPDKAAPSSPVFETQPKAGKVSGFDFARDPLNADRPNQPPEEIMKKEIANKPNVMAAQRELLEARYILEPKLDPREKMARGKPLSVGPTARLQEGVSWQQIGELRLRKFRNVVFSRTPRCLTHCKAMAGKYSPRCKSICSLVSSGSMWISIFRKRFFRNSRRRSF
jgi:hypothetical protein